MHDDTIEQRLHATLRAEAEGLPLSVTPDELERRLALRRRDRMNRRFGLLAAGVAAIAVGTMFAVVVGPFRGPNVAATPQPTIQPTIIPSPVATSGPKDPVDLLPTLEPTVGSVDFQISTVPGDPSDPDTVPVGDRYDGVRMEAREGGLQFVCLGDPVAIRWGAPEDPTMVASETVACAGAIETFRYDITQLQPLIDQNVVVDATPRTAYRILVESFGFTNEPVPTALPSFAIPAGTVLLDTRVDAVSGATGTPVPGRAGSVPARGLYRVAMVCLGTGSARWAIGAQDTRDFIDGGEMPCDGAALGFSSSTGLPSKDSSVFVTTEPGNSWHLIVTDPYGPIPFAPPAVDLWAGVDLEGRSTSAPAQCVGYDGNVDSCGLDLSARDGAHVVGVPTDSDVTIVVSEGWTINQAGVKIADRDDVRRDPSRASVREFTNSQDGSGRLTLAGDRLVMKVAGLEPGEWIVVVSIGAEKDGHTFGATYQMPLRIGG